MVTFHGRVGPKLPSSWRTCSTETTLAHKKACWWSTNLSNACSAQISKGTDSSLVNKYANYSKRLSLSVSLTKRTYTRSWKASTGFSSSSVLFPSLTIRPCHTCWIKKCPRKWLPCKSPAIGSVWEHASCTCSLQPKHPTQFFSSFYSLTSSYCSRTI